MYLNKLPLVPAHRGDDPAAIDLINLVKPSPVPFRAAERRAEKVLRAVPGNRDTRGPASEADYVHVVVLYSLSGGKVIVAKCRSHAHDFVGGHGRSHSAAAHKDKQRWGGCGEGCCAHENILSIRCVNFARFVLNS